MMPFRNYISESIATFALVFCGTGAIIINQETGGAVTHVGIAMTFGLVVTAMIFALGDVSGAHMNPAVTLSFAVAKRFPFREVIPYVLAQSIGAFMASGLLRLCFPNNEFLGATIPAGSEWQSFLFEVTLTLILVMVIFNVSMESNEKGIAAPIAIGSVVGLEAMFAGPICGASMNPIRSISPAVVSMHTEHLWIYTTAPFVGALMGVVLHQLLHSREA